MTLRVRLAALIFAVIGLTSSAFAQSAHVQNYSGTAGGTATYTITGVNASAGNAVTACLSARGIEGISGVTFAGSATGWANVGDSGAQATGTREHCWGATGLTGTGDVVITATATPAFAHPVVDVWSGANTGGAFGTSVENSGSSTSLVISGVVSDANSLVYGISYLRANDAGLTASGTQVYELAEGGFGSTVNAQYVTGSASTSVTWTGVPSTNIGGVAFSINGTSGATPLRSPMTLGMVGPQP